MEMPLHISLPLVSFEKWRIDYVGEVHPHSSRGMAYIIVATEYLTKWAGPKQSRRIRPLTQQPLCMRTLFLGLDVLSF